MLGTNEPYNYGIRCGHSQTTLQQTQRVWNGTPRLAKLHEQLPQVVMAKDFDSAWKTYMDAYNACNPDAFLSELQAELDKRMKDAAKYE